MSIKTTSPEFRIRHALIECKKGVRSKEIYNLGLDALDEIERAKPTPANPNATERLASALRAIMEFHGGVFESLLPKEIFNDANNALHMAQLPVVPVSEDVETIRDTIESVVIGPYSRADALAALDRLAAAAGRKE